MHMKKLLGLFVLPTLMVVVACSSEGGTTSPQPPDRLAQPATISATTLDDASVDVTWSAVVEPTFVGYEVFLDGDVLDTLTVTNYSYTDLDAGTNYEFAVATLGELGYRSYHTAIVHGTAVSAAPENLAAEKLSATSVRLTWEVSGEETVDHYLLYRNSTLIATVIRDSLGYTNSGLSAGTYKYLVAAGDTLGFVSAFSDTATVILP
jgi:hypothetical protein